MPAAPMVFMRRRGQQRPPAGTQINWEHPLARALTLAVPFGEGGGLPQNLVLSGHGPTTWGSGSTPPAWVGSREGRAVYLPGTSNNDLLWESRPHTYPHYTRHFSAHIRATVDGNDSTERNLLHYNTGGPFGNYIACQIYASNLFGIAWGRGFGPTASAVGATTISVDPGQMRSFTFSREALLRAACYLDGKLDGSTTTDATDFAANAAGRTSVIGANVYNGKMALLLSWLRPLAAWEAQWLHEQPWDMFRPSSPWVIYDDGVADPVQHLSVVVFDGDTPADPAPTLVSQWKLAQTSSRVSRISYSQQPPAGTPIDLSLPITQGLIMAMPFNQGAGWPQDIAPDPVSGMQLAGGAGGDIYLVYGPWTGGPYGVALRTRHPFFGGTLWWTNTNKLILTEKSAFSVFALGSIESNASEPYLPHWMTATTGGAFPVGWWIRLALPTGGSGATTGYRTQFSFGNWVGVPSPETAQGSTPVYPSTRIRSFAGVRDPSKGAIAYLDGVEDAAVPVQSGSWTSNGSLYLGTNGGEYGWGGLRYLSLVWNRALAPDEIRSLHENPFQIFAPPRTGLRTFLGLEYLPPSPQVFDEVSETESVTLSLNYSKPPRYGEAVFMALGPSSGPAPLIVTTSDRAGRR